MTRYMSFVTHINPLQAKNKQIAKRKHTMASFMVELHYCPDSSAG